MLSSIKSVEFQAAARANAQSLLILVKMDFCPLHRLSGLNRRLNDRLRLRRSDTLVKSFCFRGTGVLLLRVGGHRNEGSKAGIQSIAEVKIAGRLYRPAIR